LGPKGSRFGRPAQAVMHHVTYSGNLAIVKNVYVMVYSILQARRRLYDGLLNTTGYEMFI
jgi:hypothetical protein